MRIRRKSRAVEEPDEADLAVDEADEADDADEGADAEGSDEPVLATPDGPHDVDDLDDDVDDPESGVTRVDLGSLLVPPLPGRELRMQVDEKSGTVQSVALAGSDGAVELRAFAAPRNGDLWADIRPDIVADMERRGAKVTEREGRFGTELMCTVPVRSPSGEEAVQPSRIIGVNGPRWLLRATLIGAAALDVDGTGEWEDAVASIVVRRGAHALPVGEALPLTLPENARRVQAPGAR